MKYPETPGEVRCLLRKLAATNVFTTQINGVTVPMPLEVVLQAVEEFVRAIEGAYVGESTPSACERLVGSLFVEAIEEAVTSGRNMSNLVTIEET